MSGIVDAIFGGNDQQAPDPNPGLIAQANASADSAKIYAGVAQDQLAWSKDLANKQIALAQPVIDQQRAIAKQQMDIAGQNQANANEQWNYYKSTFQPVEQQTVRDAMNWDSPARKELLASKAEQDVAAGYDANAETAARNAMRYGGSPDSGAALALRQSAGLSRAKDMALVSNEATQNVDQQGVALRSGVANFGRNMPNTASNAFSTSISAGNSAVNSGSAAVGNSNATGSAAIGMTGGPGQWASLGNSARATAGGLYNDMYQGQLSAWNTNLQSNAGMWGGLGKLAGTALSAYGSYAGSAAIAAAMAGSSKDVKEDKAPVDGNAVLAGLSRIPVDSWKYKDGVEDSGRHVGPYAEDVQRQFGDAAAPGGKQLDLVTANGLVMAGLKALNAKVDKLSRGKVGLSRVALGDRDTEPTESDATRRGRTLDGEFERADSAPAMGLPRMPAQADGGAIYPIY